MQAIAALASSLWRRIVAFARALNQALAEPQPLETDGFERRREDTVFQPRDVTPRAHR